MSIDVSPVKIFWFCPSICSMSVSKTHQINNIYSFFLCPVYEICVMILMYSTISNIYQYSSWRPSVFYSLNDNYPSSLNEYRFIRSWEQTFCPLLFSQLPCHKQHPRLRSIWQVCFFFLSLYLTKSLVYASHTARTHQYFWWVRAHSKC